MSSRWRWAAVAIFLLSSALNFLDRQLLAAVAPDLKKEFHLNNEQIGWLSSAFYLTYSLSAPIAGQLVDRWGLTLSSCWAVIAWSGVGMATGLTRSFASLLGCRMLLGIPEAAGIPASAKAYATYLRPPEQALGNGLGQLGITLGAMGAPLLAHWLVPAHGWRSPFFAAGVGGLLWVPLWAAVSRALPAAPLPTRTRHTTRLWHDRRVWALCAANILVMINYGLWTNWTTLYLVQERGLSPAAANGRFAWMPPLFASLGGLAGGWLSFVWARQTPSLQAARWRTCAVSAVFLLGTAAVPFLPNAAWATAGISLSFFWTLCASVNLYSMPLTLFGAERAASAVALLTGAYGLLQVFFSPLVGWLWDQHQFRLVCLLAAVLPLLGVFVLKWARLDE